jgi:hypothetical protein
MVLTEASRCDTDQTFERFAQMEMEEVGITKGNSDLLQVEATRAIVAAGVAASVMVPLVNVPIWVLR